MIIEDTRKGNCLLEDLEEAAVFEKAFDGERGIYIKTDESYDTRYVKCVNLHTGRIYRFLKDSRVTVLSTKLVIEE